MTRGDLMQILSRLAATTGGHEPDESNVARIRGIADALKIDKRDDDFLKLIAFFDHYSVIYDEQYRVTEKRELRVVAKYAACAVALLLLLFGFAIWGVHHFAYKAGHAEVIPAKYEEFMHSPDFDGAFRLFKNEELASLIWCSKKGWKKKLGMCYPNDYQDAWPTGWEAAKRHS